MPHGRARTLARHARKTAPTVVPVKIDPARKKRWDALSETLRAARREEAGGYDAYWEAVGEILDKELYVAGGYDTADAFLAAEVKEPRRTALRHVRVARYATPEEEARYGTTILDAALSFIEAKTGAAIDGPLPIRFERLRVPVPQKGGATKTLSLDEATFQQITAATRALTKKTGRVAASPSEPILAKALSAVPGLADVHVRVSQGLVHFGAIPLHALADLAKVLRETKLPPPEAPKASKKKGRARGGKRGGE